MNSIKGVDWNTLNPILNTLSALKPASIFMYGSRARGDYLAKSDYELGIIFDKEKYITSAELKRMVSHPDVSTYPFEKETFIQGKIDTPFQKTIYLNDLIESAKTLRGERIVENMDAPPIFLMDILQDIQFQLGMALASAISYRHGDKTLASQFFVKSCLFGTRDYIILQQNQFLTSYEEIVQKQRSHMYGPLIHKARDIRRHKATLQEGDIYQNIKYLNHEVEQAITQKFKQNGNMQLIPW